jgi:hypothetical protein
MVDGRQADCGLNDSAVVLRLFLNADQTTGMHPNPEAVRDSKRRVRPGHGVLGTYKLRTDGQAATRIVKHPSLVARVKCKPHTTSSSLTPCLCLVRLRLLSSFVLPSHSFDSKLLKTLLAYIDCLFVEHVASTALVEPFQTGLTQTTFLNNSESHFKRVDSWICLNASPTFTSTTMSSRSTRFSGTFQPLRSTSIKMRSLKTAFSPTRPSRSASATSYSSSSTTSPLTQSRNTSGSYSRNPSPQSSRSAHSLAEIMAVRRRPSTLEFEMHMEMQAFGSELDVLEPRPMGTEHASVVGIFEVLDGKC